MPEPTAKRIVKLCLSAGLAVCDAAAALVTRRGRADRWSGIVVLYHSVPRESGGRFDAQLAMLQRLGAVVPLDDVVTEPDGTWRIAVTFDDGLRSFAEVAAPALTARGLASALFVPTAVLGAVPPWSRAGEPVDEVMDAAALHRLPGLVTLGSHGRRHVHLTGLPAGEVDDEVAGSRRDLVELGGWPVEHFASPFGDHDALSEAAVVSAGYRRSWTVDPVPVRPSDGATHGRVSLDPTDWPIEVRLKVTGAYRWMGRFMAWRRARSAPTPRATPAATAASPGPPPR